METIRMRRAETHKRGKADGKRREAPKAGAARGHGGLRNARNNEKAKPVRNDRLSKGIQTDQAHFKIKAEAVRAKLARTNLDIGRARWRQGKAERMNGKAKGLSDRNTCFIYDTNERGSGIGGKYSLMFA